MRALKAFLLGTAAVAVLGYVAAAALAMAAQAAGRALDLSVGPLVLVQVGRTGTTTETTFGAAILLLALLGGAVNAAAATILSRRAGRGAHRVD